MKRLIFLLLLGLVPSLAYASQVSITSPATAGWYKNAFNAVIKCGTSSIPYSLATEGKHTLEFSSDASGNVYVKRGDHPSELIAPMACPTDPVPAQKFKANVDVAAPSLNVGSVPASTTSDEITISGNVADSMSGIDHVNSTVDGQPGPAITIVNGKFETSVALIQGANQIELTAYDVVGHLTTSTLSITRTTNVAGSGSAGGSPLTTTNEPASLALVPRTSSVVAGTTTPAAVGPLPDLSSLASTADLPAKATTLATTQADSARPGVLMWPYLIPLAAFVGIPLAWSKHWSRRTRRLVRRFTSKIWFYHISRHFRRPISVVDAHHNPVTRSVDGLTK